MISFTPAQPRFASRSIRPERPWYFDHKEDPQKKQVEDKVEALSQAKESLAELADTFTTADDKTVKARFQALMTQLTDEDPKRFELKSIVCNPKNEAGNAQLIDYAKTQASLWAAEPGRVLGNFAEEKRVSSLIGGSYGPNWAWQAHLLDNVAQAPAKMARFARIKTFLEAVTTEKPLATPQDKQRFADFVKQDLIPPVAIANSGSALRFFLQPAQV